MSRYQIRTPEEKALEDVLNEMVAAGWEAARPHLKVNPPNVKDREAFSKSIFNTIMPYVRTFRLCGLSNICLDEVYSAPLSKEWAKVDVNPWDLVYHIFYRGDAEEFVEVIGFEAVESISRLMKEDSKNAFSDVCAALRGVLGKYLYYSPVCGRTELCVFSSSSPIAPMGRH